MPFQLPSQHLDVFARQTKSQMGCYNNQSSALADQALSMIGQELFTHCVVMLVLPQHAEGVTSG